MYCHIVGKQPFGHTRQYHRADGNRWKMKYHSEIQLKHKSRDITFANALFFSFCIVLCFHQSYDSDRFDNCCVMEEREFIWYFIPGSVQGYISLQWCHNNHDSVSNHQPHGCLLNRLFRRRSKKTSKPRFAGLCARNSPVTGEFPAQRASDAEKVSIWWRHHNGIMARCHIVRSPQHIWRSVPDLQMSSSDLI